jgi:hypothetical protein
MVAILACALVACDPCEDSDDLGTCSERKVCCPVSLNSAEPESCYWLAAQGGETREFECEDKDDCKSAINEVLAYCGL